MRSLWLLAKRDWRERYPGFWAGFGDVFALAISLSIYWFTARAFGEGMQGKLEGLATDYFSFVVLGEAVLLVPLAIITGFLRVTREAAADGTLDALLMLPWSGVRAISSLGLSSLPREFMRSFLILGIAALIFGFESSLDFSSILLAQLASVPAAIVLGWVAVAFFLRFGRGEGALGFLVTLATILAGAYFPLTVFPDGVRELSLWISPLSAGLEIARNGLNSEQLRSVWVLGGWALLGLPLGALALKASVSKARERGSLEVIV